MRRKERANGTTLLVAVATVMLCAAAGWADLLDNGGFESTPDGTTLSSDGTSNVSSNTLFSGWRFFAVNGANASATVRAGAGVGGNHAMELYRGVNAAGASGADTALDRDDSTLRIPTGGQPRIYKFTLQGKDGPAGGTPTLKIGSQFFTPGGSYVPALSKTVNWNPGSDWETYGLTGRTDSTIGLMSTRIDMGGSGADVRSGLVDNVAIEDATFGVNRLINGGFEGSTSRVLAWRTYNLGGSAAASATLSSDARTDSKAALFSVTNVTGATDIGFDFDANRVATLPGEMVRLSFAAKKVSGGDIQLAVEIPGYDFTSPSAIYQGPQLPGGRLYVTPGTDGYDYYSVDFPLGDNVFFAKATFSIRDATGSFQTGSYLIDDVAIVGVPEPASLLLAAAGVLPLVRRRSRRA